MGSTLSCCDKQQQDIPTEYGDYIFNHSNVLRLQVSKLLSDHISKGEYIVLHVIINDEHAQHTCLVHSVTDNNIFISLIDEWKSINEMEYIKSIII